MDYPYENLTPEKFQQFCQSLLVKEYPDVQCFPVAQPDGGRDAVSYYRQPSPNDFVVFQVKFVRQPDHIADPHLWLADVLSEELPKVIKLIPKGAKKYITITNVRGTAHPNTGSIDKVNALLAGLGIESMCWWRDDLNRRLDNAWSVKWVYQELMTGPDLIHAIIETGLSESKERRANAIRAYVQDQFTRDEDVRFKQVDLQHKLLNLFIDLPVTPPHAAATKKNQIRYDRFFRQLFLSQRSHPKQDNALSENLVLLEDEDGDIIYVDDEAIYHPRHDQPPIGAATVLLHPLTNKFAPRMVIEGAPGQGKSTITQYICQVHRMRILKRTDLLGALNPEHAASPVRLPFKVDLRDYATWLAKKDPFSGEREDAPPNWQKSLESFLAAQIRYHSGGIEFNQSDLAAVVKLSAVLLALDGLDEVVDIDRRQEVVEEIVAGVKRLEANAASIQVVVTSRPAAFANSPGLPDVEFPCFQLSSVTRQLIDEYANKWVLARGLHGPEGSEIKRILKNKVDQPHIRELAKNPMQLTILLSLIHTRGSSLPDKRTALYDNYVDLFFNREAEKNPIVRDHRDLLINIHQYLAWVLHAESEMGRNSGSVTEERLHQLLKGYLTTEGYDPRLSSDLFTGMVERVVALVSRVQGTYEFEVQPLREYFAARYLYETAPYSPAGDEKRGALPDRFNAIARDFYWLNVTRFYAGCYSKGELPSLIDCLKDLVAEGGYKFLSHPRVLASTLLSDWVFTQHPKSVQEVIKLVLDGIGLRYVLASDTRRVANGSPLILPNGCGREELIQQCLQELKRPYANDYLRDVIDILRSNSSQEELVQLWVSHMPRADSSHRIRWIEHGLYLGVLAKVELEQLKQILEGLDSICVARLMFRARRFDYVELDDQKVSDGINAILQRQIESDGNQRLSNILEVFSEVIMPARYAVSFRATQPAPLNEIWKGYSLFDAAVMFPSRIDSKLPAPRFSAQTKCLEFINLASEMSVRSGGEWAGTLEPWDQLVEKGCSLWGQQWAFEQMANVSGGIKSQLETYKEFDELLDRTISLCKRTRYARLRAGNYQWWRKQIEASKSDSEKCFVTLISATWSSMTTLIQLAEVLDAIISAFDNEQWLKIYVAVREAVVLTRTSNDRLITLDINSLSTSLNPRTVVLFALRTRNSDDLYRHYLKTYNGDDATILQFCFDKILDEVASGKPQWETALDLITANYKKGSPAPRFGPRIYSHRLGKVEIPDPIAERVLKHPEEFPSFLVSMAEQRYRHSVAKTIVPVGKIAQRDAWFHG